MSPLQRINFLIDQHVEVPYSICPGCEHCEEIKKISKESGLWLGDSSRKVKEGKKRANELTKERLKPYLDAGLSIREISKREGCHESTICRKVQRLFPEYVEKRKRDVMPFRKYIRLKKKGYKDPEIARQENVGYQKLRYQVLKWQKAGKLSGEVV